MFEPPEGLLLARIPFTFIISFHFLFPAITIGRASGLAVLHGLGLKTGREDHRTGSITGSRSSRWCWAWACSPVWYLTASTLCHRFWRR